jgi:transposase-like protein
MSEDYSGKRFVLFVAWNSPIPKAIETRMAGWRTPFPSPHFLKQDTCMIALTNIVERLNEEIWRRTRVVGIFSTPDAYLLLVTAFLME